VIDGKLYTALMVYGGIRLVQKHSHHFDERKRAQLTTLLERQERLIDDVLMEIGLTEALELSQKHVYELL
jgi:hypothetical protein